MKRSLGFVAVFLVVILLLAESIFFKPLPVETRVVVNGKGYFNPYCHGEARYERWNVLQSAQLCKPMLAVNREGVIRKGGDYQASFLDGVYRVVFDNGEVFWFKAGDVKKIE